MADEKRVKKRTSDCLGIGIAEIKTLILPQNTNQLISYLFCIGSHSLMPHSLVSHLDKAMFNFFQVKQEKERRE